MKPDIKELLILSLKRNATYVYNRIPRAKNQKEYLKAINACLSIFEKNEDSLSMREQILSLKKAIDLVKSNWLFRLFGNNNYYYKLGCTHALEVLKSIVDRFDGSFREKHNLNIFSLNIPLSTQKDPFKSQIEA